MTAPPLSSRLVNVAEDAELRLVSLLGEHSPSLDVAQCEACISSGDALKLLEKILADKGSVAALVTQISDLEEAVGSFTLLVALIAGASNDEDTAATHSMVCDLANAVVQAGDSSEVTCERKLRLLAVLYNLRAPVLDKVELLRQMIIVAGEFPSAFLRAQDPLGRFLLAADETEESSEKNIPGSDQLALTPSIPRIVQLLESWHVDAENRFNLYQTIVESLHTNDMIVRKQRFLLLLVECSSSKKDAVAAAAKETAIGAIRDPISLFAHQRNILNVPSISALEKSDALLFGLLKIFQEGKLSDYETFLEANGGQDAVLGELQLDTDMCRRNMRILSLCSLASEHEEIPYASIAETLQIDASDKKQVEAQVIAAVNSGLLQAKIDQLSEKVLVERCVVRKFDIPQWKNLQGRLKTWKESVGAILSALEKAQATAAGETTAATT